jgi:Tfp pilus assembly protein PilF
MTFDLESEHRLGERDEHPVPGAWFPVPGLNLEPEALNLLGAEAFAEERYADAVTAFEAAVAALTPEDDPVACELFENLGLALLHHGRPQRGAQAFLRALDGEPTSREQSLRFLVTCLANMGHARDAESYLSIYRDAHGEHPAFPS